MLETKDREIAGAHFRVKQLPGMQSVRMFTRITKLAGPAIGAMTKDDAQLARLLDQDAAGLGGAVATFCEDLDAAEVEDIARTFAKHSQVKLEGLAAESEDGWLDMNEAIFDQTFGGRIDRFLGWLTFCLQVNYDSFLGAARRLPRPSASKSETG